MSIKSLKDSALCALADMIGHNEELVPPKQYEVHVGCTVQSYAVTHVFANNEEELKIKLAELLENDASDLIFENVWDSADDYRITLVKDAASEVYLDDDVIDAHQRPCFALLGE